MHQFVGGKSLSKSFHFDRVSLTVGSANSVERALCYDD